MSDNRLFDGFCYVGNNVKRFRKVIDGGYYRQLKKDSKKYSVIISEHYSSCCDLCPVELFFIYDPAEKKLRVKSEK